MRLLTFHSHLLVCYCQGQACHFLILRPMRHGPPQMVYLADSLMIFQESTTMKRCHRMDRTLGPSFPALPIMTWSGPWQPTRSCTILRWAISDTVGRVKNSIWASRRISRSVILIIWPLASRSAICLSTLTMWPPIHGLFQLLTHPQIPIGRIFQFLIMGIAQPNSIALPVSFRIQLI